LDYFEAFHASLAGRGELPLITDAAFRERFLIKAQEAGITDRAIWIQGERGDEGWFGFRGIPLPYLDFYDGHEPVLRHGSPALSLITDFAKAPARRRKMTADRRDLRQQFAYIVWDD
jgi:hypothetical protein